MSTLRRGIVPLILGVAIWIVPAPAGLTPSAWAYFALFVAVITGLITEPFPGPVIGVLGIALAATLRFTAASPDDSLRWALSGFSHPTVWLIFIAFMFGLGYERTGLGRRIALALVRRLGGTTLGLGYAIALADLALAPFTPSNTARSGGMIFPIIRSIPGLYDSSPDQGRRRIGAYLMWTAFAATGITSSMFLTANAANLFAVSLIRDTTGTRIGWSEWAIGFLPVGLALFLTLPALAYLIYPPSLKASPDVPEWARGQLAALGGITRREVIMAVVTILALAFWIFAGAWLNATTVGFIALALMFLTKTLMWHEVLAYQSAWNVLVWFGTLVTLADGLSRVGFVSWFADRAVAALSGVSITMMVPLFVALFFAAHYFFASLTAHATALLPAFLVAGTAVPGMRVRPLMLALCYAVGLMGVLTPYATGPAPIYFGSGYISRKEFWTLGLVFGLLYLLTLLALGLPYLWAIFP